MTALPTNAPDTSGKTAHWLIPIEGEAKSIDFLTRYLGQTQISIVRATIEGAEHTCIKAPGSWADNRFQALDVLGPKLIGRLNGAASLIWSHFQNVAQKSMVCHVDADGTTTPLVVLTAPLINRTLDAFPFGTPLGEWYNLALRNPMADAALAVYAELKSSWVGLYMILDIITEDLGKQAVWEAGLMTEDQFRLFTRTANSFPALGTKARHARLKWTPPEKPMRLEEAEELVASALEKWIRDKAARPNPYSQSPTPSDP